MTARPQQSAAAKKAARRKKKRNRIIAKTIAIILSLIMLACAAYFLKEIITLDILPKLYLLILVALVVFISLLMAWGFAIKSKRKVSRILLGIITVVLAVTYGVGGYYLDQTTDLFDSVTDLASKTVYSISVMTMKEGGAENVSSLNGTIGVMSSDEPEENQKLVEKLKADGANIQTEDFDNPYALVDALYAGQVQAIAFPEKYHADVSEQANAYNNYLALTLVTQTIYDYRWTEDRDPDTINRADPVGNVLTDSFTVLISGNDSYGSLLPNSRSDVNMLVTVNPKTSTILLTSIPRDTYVNLTCSKNAKACAQYAGQEDKLTHAGLLGLGTLESSLEDLLNIEINYTVRINFSSLVNIIDSVGGIDVEVPEGLEVDKFYANGLEGVKAGVNHLDGERALSFARERNAYLDGDYQRVRNQQEVIRALIHKMMSPAMVIHYPAFIKALSSAFETNMPAQSIKSLVAMEILRFPNWNILSCSMTGENELQFSAMNGDYASVSVSSAEELSRIHKLITDVEAGKEVSIEEMMPAGSYNAIGQDTPIDPNDITPEQNWTEPAYETPQTTDPYGTPLTGSDHPLDGTGQYGTGYEIGSNPGQSDPGFSQDDLQNHPASDQTHQDSSSNSDQPWYTPGV